MSRRTVALVLLLGAACARGPGGGPSPAPPRSGGVPPPVGGARLLTPVPPARSPDTDDAPPSVRLAASRPPGPGGWYTAAVRVRADAFDDRGLEDVCFWVVPNYPTGTSASSARLPCTGPRGRRWTASRELREEARYIVQLLARDTAGQEARAENLDLRLDLTPPRTTFRQPAGPFPGGRVRLEGWVEDASSGPREVVLAFRGPGGERRAQAACACPDVLRRNRPPEPWTFEGELPPGRWTVRATATDHAGLREPGGPSLTIEVA